jgi:hypothetical protein
VGRLAGFDHGFQIVQNHARQMHRTQEAPPAGRANRRGLLHRQR